MNNLKFLSNGSDGEIYSLENNKIVKSVNIDKLNTLEIYILTRLNSIYINNSYKILIESSKIYIYQDRADCDLNSFIKSKKKEKKYFSAIEKIKYIRQLVHGLYYLNSKHIVHGDIKPSNILVYNDVLKYNDFSMSKDITDGLKISHRKMYTLGYRAPECSNNIYSIQSDIWALGCTIYELYFSKNYFKIDNKGLTYHLKDLQEDSLENNFIIKIIKNMIVKEPEKRITIQELYEKFK